MMIVLVIYSVLLVGVGLFVARRVKGAGDFLVAGRSLGPGLLAATFLAANIGAGSTVAASGLGYAQGIGAWWWVGSAAIGSFILANTVGPKIWSLAAQHDWRTVGDFLEFRYDVRVRALVAALLWVGTLMILAGQLIAISQILQVVAGVEKWQGCLIGGAVISAYFAAGGLLSSAWVNLVQLTVKFTGFFLAVPFAIAAAGGWSALRPALFHPSAPPGWSGIASYIVILVPSFVVSPGLIQKLYGARDARSVRIGVNLNAIGLLVFAFVPAILGAAAHVQYPALTDHEAALPIVMTQLLPAWLGLLALAAVFSAELSASDAVLFMLSSSLSIDLYQTLLRRNASDRDVLRVARGSAITAGMVSVVLAMLLPSIITALKIFYTLMAVALTAPFVVGLYSRRPAARRALVAIVGAVGAMLITRSTPIGILTGFVVMVLP